MSFRLSGAVRACRDLATCSLPLAACRLPLADAAATNRKCSNQNSYVTPDYHNMKLSFVLCLIPAVAAFAPLQKPVCGTSTKLDATRRDVLLGIAAATTAAAARAQPAVAKQAGIGSDWGFIDDEVVSAQQPTGDRVDVNNAAIVSTLTSS